MKAPKLILLLLLFFSQVAAQNDDLPLDDPKPTLPNSDTSYAVDLSLQQDGRYGFVKIIPVHGKTSDILNSLSKWATETFNAKDGLPYQIDREAALFSARPNVKVMWSSSGQTHVWSISFTWIVYVKDDRIKVTSSEYKYWSDGDFYNIEYLNPKKEEIIVRSTSLVISNLLSSMIKTINDEQDW